MKNASKPTNATVSSISKADPLWMKFESTSGAERHECDCVGAPVKPKPSSCLNTADYFHYVVSFIQCRHSVESGTLPDIPLGTIGETLGGPLLSLEAVALVHSPGF